MSGTKYPYQLWFDGNLNQLRSRWKDLKPGEERRVSKSVMALAKEKNWAVVCRAVFPLRGDPYIVVWGDMSLPYGAAPPPHVQKDLDDLGIKTRRKWGSMKSDETGLSTGLK